MVGSLTKNGEGRKGSGEKMVSSLLDVLNMKKLLKEARGDQSHVSVSSS